MIAVGDLEPACSVFHSMWITLCENDKDVIHVMWKGATRSTADDETIDAEAGLASAI
jgi:hypothetical protein